MRPVELIRKKRFGEELTEADIRSFVSGVVNGEFTDYQTAAMLMAICIRGMSDRETLALTLAMAKTGESLDLTDIEGIKADKHSTGGVGDTTSLILVPLLAACDLKVAMMSGRGLGHTGGTLDKLESIPGMNINPGIEAFKRQVRDVGCAIIGQSTSIAPADKALYALRDVTGTVDCVPLIISSILSKKLAAGSEVVTLDVKYGSGSFCQKLEDAKTLAEKMVRIGSMSGRRFSALVTCMEEPLGNCVGNALEVRQAVEILAGREQNSPLKRVSLELGALTLSEAGAVRSIGDGRALLQSRIDSGEGLAKLAEMIRAQGGDPAVVYDVSLLPQAKSLYQVRAFADGYVRSMATDRIGFAAQLLGAGRLKKTDSVDPAVGLIMKKRLGDPVERGDVLCEVHANPSSDVRGALEILNSAFVIGAEKPERKALIVHVAED